MDRHCEHCGTPAEENQVFCNECGQKIGDNVAAEGAYTNPDGGYPAKPKSKKRLISILSVVFFLVAAIAGRTVSNYLMGKYSEHKESNKIDEYIEKLEKYRPGELSKDKYVSEHFGFQFDFSDEWHAFSEGELKEYTDTVRQSAISSGTEAMKKENISQELQNKMLSSFYGEAEMGANYVEDNEVMGIVVVGVFGMYGLEDGVEDTFIDGMKDEALNMKNVTKGERVLAGKTFKTLKFTITEQGIDIANEFLVMIHDDIMCMITCQAIEGYENKVINSFVNNVKNVG